ncbi:MAG: DUF1593 domain-containing protein [Prolixibacteraceae bacterium]
MKVHFQTLATFLCVSLFFVSCAQQNKTLPYRIIVSTDIGGTDFDDYQSLAHLLLYADTLDIEGILSSPYGDGRKQQILEAIDAYEIDYPNLKTYSNRYPTADSLRKITKQGAKNDPGPIGFGAPSEGSEWIIECARRTDKRPLYVLIWGGIEDLAQALHDAPDIVPKLRVYFIGGPNKKWSVNAYQYIAENFPQLWIIESNATYRGWFVGGNQTGRWGNQEFVETDVKESGALGNYFYSYGGTIKMGDTPSLAYFLHGNPEDPTQPGWGGQYVRAWDRPYRVFDRMSTPNDSIEEFGVVEFRLPLTDHSIENPSAVLNIDRPIQGEFVNDTLRFLFSPKTTSTYHYTIESNLPSVNGLSGTIRSYRTPASNKMHPSASYPNWWTDDPSPEFMENGHIGIKTVNVWREEFLSDFARRMKRCASALD